MRLGIIGMPGKMAVRIVALAAESFTVTAAIARAGNAAVGRDAGEMCGVGKNGVLVGASAEFSQADVWIEFSHASVTAGTVAAARAAKKPLLIGTTGLDEATREAVRAAGTDIAVLLAPNTSLGVAVLNAALRLAVHTLGADFAAELVELHHDKKRDAPSGTALRLVETIKAARAGSKVVSGRDGLVGPRAAEEIGVFAVRGGNVIGEHTVYLIGAHERLELTHRAQSRDLFADGALRAAAWLAHKPAGLYSIEDSLGLNT